MPFADLELNFVQFGAAWRVELRLITSDHDGDERLDFNVDPPACVTIDQAALDAAATDDEYGRLLGAMLFRDPRVLRLYQRARTRALGLRPSVPLRLQLSGLDARLHALRWELVHDPIDERWISVCEDVHLSRHVSGPQVESGDLDGLRSLVVIAGGDASKPYVVHGRPLAPIDVDDELRRAEIGLAGTQMTVLAAPGRCTLDAIAAALRAGCDIFYLVCHGAMLPDRHGGPPRAVIFLEDDTGAMTGVLAELLVERVAQLSQSMPRLAVLASCKSAGHGLDARADDDGALAAALGPRLAQVGVPAVVAMNGNVTMATVAAFMPTFFAQFRATGNVDAAVCEGRAAIQGRPDAWMPVLFTHLRPGRSWPADGRLPRTKWESLMTHIGTGDVVAVLGPELLQPFIGSTREMAQALARSFDCALQLDERGDLTRVAQYLAVNHDRAFPRTQIKQYICRTTRERFGDSADPTDPDRQLLHAAEALRAQPDRYEPHAILASLPFRVYVSANPDSLLSAALRRAERAPQELFLDRSPEPLAQPDVIYDRHLKTRPPEDQPIVYQFFGRLDADDPLVLTEDDYLDMLLGMRAHEKHIPGIIPSSLRRKGLLFLGFRIDDWSFRVLLHWIMNPVAPLPRTSFTNIAVQIDPDRPGIEEPEAARRYIEGYLREAKIDIYWGTTESFLRKLNTRWQARLTAPARPPQGDPR